jgi:hypothetical protein
MAVCTKIFHIYVFLVTYHVFFSLSVPNQTFRDQLTDYSLISSNFIPSLIGQQYASSNQLRFYTQVTNKHFAV